MVTAPSEQTFVAEVHEAGMHVRGLGEIRIREPAMTVVPTALAGHDRRPLGANYEAFATAFLEACIEPSVGPRVIAALPRHYRRKLMLSVVRLRKAETLWRTLYGSHLSVEERFFAVMWWADARDYRDLLFRLRQARTRSMTAAGSAVLAASRAARPPVALTTIGPSFAPIRRMHGVMKSLPALATIGMPQVALTTPLAHRLAADTPPAALRDFALSCWGVDGRLQDPVRVLKRPLTQIVQALVARSLVVHRRALVQPIALRAMHGLICMPPLHDGRLIQNALRPYRRLLDTFGEVAAFIDDWREDPLWFLLSVCLGSSRELIPLSHDEVEDALLDALEGVVLDGELVATLEEVVREAPYLDQLARRWLIHALGHAERSEWDQAIPPFVLGFEGALYGAARARALVPAEEGKFTAAESLVKMLPVSPEYTAFVVRRVYGGQGNAFRHGRADSGERRQMLHCVVALVGWVDAFMGLSGMQVLAGLLDKRLPGAVDRGGAEQPLLGA